MNFVDPWGLCEKGQKEYWADFWSWIEESGLASGFTFNGSWVNPLTSRGGGVLGFNRVTFWETNQTIDYDYNSFDRGAIGLDIGVAMESVWAFGSGNWEGNFDSLNANIALIAVSIFRSSDQTDGNGWSGISFGIGPGIGGAIEGTTYRRSPIQPMRDLGY